MNRATDRFSTPCYQMIIEYMQVRKSITVKRTAELCGVSDATARRYLDNLEKRGSVKRIHGGAVLKLENGCEQAHSERMKHMILEKTRIAERAFGMIQDGNSVFVDSGVTMLLLAKRLHHRKNLTVVTNNLDIAFQAELDKSSVMVVTGGIRRECAHLLTGQIAEHLLHKLSMDKVFLSADAVNMDKGVFNRSFLETGIKRSALASGRQRILLCDHTKFQRHALARICDVEDFDTILTDKGMDKETQKILDQKVKKLIVV